MTPTDPARCFARDYAEARGLFVRAAEAADLDVAAHVHPLRGVAGEALAIDVVHDGGRDARRVLIVSSGCHGVEGYCGSALQCALLGDAKLRARARVAGVAVLHLHALNPYGFSWGRRVTQENVDLNRNFVDFHAPLPANPLYEALAGMLVPPTWPPAPAVTHRLMALVAQHGLQALQAVVSGGQYDFPEGLFYGGRNPTWSHQALRHVLQDHGRHCERLGWIDVHTGLGPRGVAERILACRADDTAACARARAWWGPQVTATDDGSASSAPITGFMALAAPEECPQAEVTAITLEFGTVPVLEVIEALRGEQWAELHPEAPAQLQASLKRRLRDAFYPADDAGWQAQVLSQGRQVVREAIEGLARA